MADFRATGQFTIPLERGARTRRTRSLSRWPTGLTQTGFRFAVSPLVRQLRLPRRLRRARGRTHPLGPGIHYFASREPDDRGPLTWPEGNGWIANRLIEKLRPYLRTGSVVYRVARAGNKLRVLTEDTEYLAEAVIWAAPTFLAHYIIEEAPPAVGFDYSPWLTANLTLDHIPGQKGMEPAWDNVIYDSPALGYVNATHMSLATHVDRTVWTFYWSLAEHPPAQARQLLLSRSWTDWKEAILNDLGRAHPDIRQCVTHIDIMRIGHAMVRPRPGFMFSRDRERWLRPLGNVYFANSDLSGISIFEEAQYRGVEAAAAALRRLSGS